MNWEERNCAQSGKENQEQNGAATEGKEGHERCQEEDIIVSTFSL